VARAIAVVVGRLPAVSPETCPDMGGWGRFELPTSASRSQAGRTGAVSGGRNRRSCPSPGQLRPTAVECDRGVDAGRRDRNWRSAQFGGVRSRSAHTRFTRWSGASAGAVETSPRSRWRQLPARRDSPRRLQRLRPSGHDNRRRLCDLLQSEQVDVTYRTACRSPDSSRLPSPNDTAPGVGFGIRPSHHRRWEQPGLRTV